MKIVFYPELPKMEKLTDGTENWSVCENWVSQLVEGKAVLVKKGMVTDGASIPRFFWRFIGHPLMGWILGHALPHDALYMAELMERDKCDKFLLNSMVLAGVPWWKRNAVWSAVRLGGSLVWMKHNIDNVIADRKYCVLIDSEQYTALKLCVKMPTK